MSTSYYPTQTSECDQPIVIQARSSTLLPNGQPSLTWSNINNGKMFAKREETGGNNFQRAQQQFSELDALFVVRWRSDITAQMKLIHEGREFLILGVSAIGRHQWLQISTKRMGDIISQ